MPETPVTAPVESFVVVVSVTVHLPPEHETVDFVSLVEPSGLFSVFG